jgi:hypothetical protein
MFNNGKLSELRRRRLEDRLKTKTRSAKIMRKKKKFRAADKKRADLS